MDRELRSFLMGFTYDDEHEEAADRINDDWKIDKWIQKNPDFEEEFIFTRKKKDKAGGARYEKKVNEAPGKYVAVNLSQSKSGTTK